MTGAGYSGRALAAKLGIRPGERVVALGAPAHYAAIREIALPCGVVDVKVCAVDAVWSGLKLVRRRELRR